MSKTSIVAIVVAVLLVSLVGFNLFVADGSEDNPVTTSIREETPTVVTQEEAEAAPVDQPRGVFEQFSVATFAAANERGDKTVLFFHAEWCPTCKNLARNLEAGTIPDGLSILQVDYDSATELRQKHGVTFQHTLVQIDEAGETITRWAGSNQVQEIVDELI